MEENQQKVKATCIHNGPLRISGVFEFELPSGEKQELDGTVAVCRCGLSSKMPLCDGSHKNSIPGHDGT